MLAIPPDRRSDSGERRSVCRIWSCVDPRAPSAVRESAECRLSGETTRLSWLVSICCGFMRHDYHPHTSCTLNGPYTIDVSGEMMQRFGHRRTRVDRPGPVERLALRPSSQGHQQITAVPYIVRLRTIRYCRFAPSSYLLLQLQRRRISNDLVSPRLLLQSMAILELPKTRPIFLPFLSKTNYA